MTEAPKLALLMASNYDWPGSQARLHGCLSDQDAMFDLLKARGFTITTLSGRAMTRVAMIAAMTDLAKAIGPNGIGVIHYSGHGTTGPTATPDPHELGPTSEAWVPDDYRSAGMLWDDDIAKALAHIHPDGRGLLISDSCYAEQVSRFAPPISAAPAMMARPKLLPFATWGPEVYGDRLLKQIEQAGGSPADFHGRKAEAAVEVFTQTGKAAKAPRPFPWVELAACQDNQVAWCADVPSDDGAATVARGAFTWAVEQVLARNPSTYAELMVGSRWFGPGVIVGKRGGILPSRDLANQTPALIGSPGRIRWATLEPSG